MSYSKIFSGNSPELAYEIMNYFQNDFSTLYSCILVNRLWCRLTIPLLWENPFSIPTKNFSFIETYLYNLNDDLKMKLNEYKIIYKSLPSNTLFNYPSFLKYLNTMKIISSIERWTEVAVGTLKSENRDLDSVFNFKRLLHMSLFKIFIDNEVNLHTFEIEIADRDYNYSYFNDILELILQNTNFIYNIGNLNLYIGNPSCSSYHNNSNEYALIKNRILQIINSYRNLKKISLYHSHYSLYQPLLLSEDYNCSNTLKTIILYYIDFKGIINLTKIFEQLNVLESVHIIYCYSLNISFVQQIINLTKPFKLKSLFTNEIPQIEPLELLLQKSGYCLENFGFSTTLYNITLTLQQQLLELVIKYCKNINFLCLSGIASQVTYLIFNLIENIKHNLNYLSINMQNNDIETECSSIILQNLGQTLPSKLEYLNLGLHVKKSDFEIFLKNSQDTFIKKLLIYNEEGQDILSSIKEFIMKKKRINYLSIYDSFIIDTILDYEYQSKDLFSLNNEVREFRLYNIKVQSYYDSVIGIYDFIKENN
ncbi:hypothetical protein GLOIN_2v1881853 [Rhizophagus clarus]|uniref:F-box domain-containing protein n=1 Tax=Rhizophagus clarus TaxID=94130 RepID=A0A8H3KRY5_9GLOM|nr:hypothetical protein GLOIN_2v1881853 [Rhizophagus clarus]